MSVFQENFLMNDNLKDVMGGGGYPVFVGSGHIAPHRGEREREERGNNGTEEGVKLSKGS